MQNPDSTVYLANHHAHTRYSDGIPQAWLRKL